MNQLALTYAPAVDKLCGARRTDPLSSHEADEDYRKSGKAQTDAEHVRWLLGVAYRCRPHTSEGITYQELANAPACILGKHAVMKRLCDNERLRLVEKVRDAADKPVLRRCSVSGRRVSQWRPV